MAQGALAPVLASCALFGAFVVIKLFPDLDLQTLLSCYFWFIGGFAVAGAMAAPLKQLVGLSCSGFQWPFSWSCPARRACL
jgi:hypothetical protein